MCYQTAFIVRFVCLIFCEDCEQNSQAVIVKGHILVNIVLVQGFNDYLIVFLELLLEAFTRIQNLPKFQS